MQWVVKNPEYGDMIRVKMGIFQHYGIFETQQRVFQFGFNHTLPPEERPGTPMVCCTDLVRFANGETPEVAVFGPTEYRHDPKTAISLAEGRLGETGYHILHNNCEHFARECITGNRYCAQVEDVRNMFRNMPVTDLYIAPIPEGEMGTLIPALRQAQLEETNHPGLRRQRYFVWKLLEYALERSFGLKMENLDFSRSESGKWICAQCCFSLSHCKEAVAVAVSRKPVGVDIEPLIRPVTQRLADKILTDRERAELDTLPPKRQDSYLLEKWSAKESLFKAGEEEKFLPRQLETENRVAAKYLELDGKQYVCTVASEELHCLRTYENIDLTKK